jgi:hypothetical protein
LKVYIWRAEELLSYLVLSLIQYLSHLPSCSYTPLKTAVHRLKFLASQVTGNTVSSHPFSHFPISEIEGAVASVPKEKGDLFFNARFLEEIPKKQMLIKDWVTEVYLGVNAHSH